MPEVRPSLLTCDPGPFTPRHPGVLHPMVRDEGGAGDFAKREPAIGSPTVPTRDKSECASGESPSGALYTYHLTYESDPDTVLRKNLKEFNLRLGSKGWGSSTKQTKISLMVSLSLQLAGTNRPINHIPKRVGGNKKDNFSSRTCLGRIETETVYFSHPPLLFLPPLFPVFSFFPFSFTLPSSLSLSSLPLPCLPLPSLPSFFPFFFPALTEGGVRKVVHRNTDRFLYRSSKTHYMG